MDGVQKAGLDNVKLSGEPRGVQFPGLAIGRVEDVLVSSTEGRCIAGVHETLQVGFDKVRGGEVNPAAMARGQRRDQPIGDRGDGERTLLRCQQLSCGTRYRQCCSTRRTFPSNDGSR